MNSYFFGTFLLFIFSNLTASLVAGTKIINIAGLLARTGPITDNVAPYAVDLALSHIRHAGILPGYNISVDWRDSGCSSKKSLVQYFNYLTTNKSYATFLGALCSVATGAVAELIPLYNYTMISYGSTSPSLANNERYPTFIRGIPSDINTIFGQIFFIKDNNFRRLAIINEQEDIFTSISEQLQKFLKMSNIIYDSEIFSLASQNFQKRINLILENIMKQGYRVIVASMYEDAFIYLLCELKNFPSLHAPDTTWIMLGWYNIGWIKRIRNLNSKCSLEEIKNLATGMIAIDSVPNIEDLLASNSTTIAGYTPKQIYDAFRNRTIEDRGVNFFNKNYNIYNLFAYDAMWTIAVGLNRTLSEISYEDIHKYPNILYKHMIGVNFTGSTGRVHFNGHERHDGRIVLMETIRGVYEVKGLYTNIPFNISDSNQLNNIKYSQRNDFKVWNPETATDGIIDHSLQPVIAGLTLFFAILIFIFITYCIISILVGYFKKLDAVIQAGPIITIIILSGNYTLLLLAILTSIDAKSIQSLNSQLCTFICQLRFWLFAISISIILGGMIGKAIKLYVIAILNKFRYSKSLKIQYMILFPLTLVIIDTVYMVIWYAAAPLQCIQKQIDSGITNTPFFIITECGLQTKSIYLVLIWLLFSLKALLVIIGILLAYNVRRVINKGNKYSSVITLTIYNVTIFAISYLLIIKLIENVDVKYSLASFITLFCASSTTAIIAGPILYYQYKDPHGKSFVHTNAQDTYPEDNILLKNQVNVLQKDKQTLEMHCSILEKENQEFQSSLSSDATRIL